MARHWAGCASLVAALVTTACSDDAAAPDLTPAAIQPRAGDDQSALLGAAVATAPAVTVTNASGDPLRGIVVSFIVIAGGGSADVTSARTDALGAASAGRWTLGLAPGANLLEARVDGLPGIQFTATSVSPFQIVVRYIGGATDRQRQAVNTAVLRWSTAIVSELTDIPISTTAGGCFARQPSINEIVDDLLLFVEFVEIDGAGSVLGQAGPCFVRNSDGLPIVGYLKLDATDLARMEAIGTLDDLVLHEIGHTLGIGVLWPDLLTGKGTTDPRFIGANALAAYRQLGGTQPGVPVENTGGIGTRDSHWREAVFGNELMTGYLSSSPNPLSAITVASLQDLGYTINGAAASTYQIAANALSARVLVDLHGAEVTMLPMYRIDRLGIKHKIGS